MASADRQQVAAVVRGAADGRTEDQLVLLLISAPAAVRLAAMAWWHAAEWAGRTGMRAGTRLLQAASDGESPADLLEDATLELRSFLRTLLELTDGVVSEGAEADPPSAANGAALSLRARGAELLRRSAEVGTVDDTHPAYAHILDDLAPDEARILRLLCVEGPRAAVDIRRGGPLGLNAGSELVAPGLAMIGAESGCRRSDRVPAYLNNLYRLGLIWFSREPLSDQAPYQVLEAQPEVTEALAAARRGRVVRRSIRLTPFGRDFCDTCLPIDPLEVSTLEAQMAAEGDRLSGVVIAGDGSAEILDRPD